MQEGEEFYSTIDMAKADNGHDEGLGAARGRTKGDDWEWHHSKIGKGEGSKYKKASIRMTVVK